MLVFSKINGDGKKASSFTTPQQGASCQEFNTQADITKALPNILDTE